LAVAQGKLEAGQTLKKISTAAATMIGQLLSMRSICRQGAELPAASSRRLSTSALGHTSRNEKSCGIHVALRSAEIGRVPDQSANQIAFLLGVASEPQLPQPFSSIAHRLLGGVIIRNCFWSVSFLLFASLEKSLSAGALVFMLGHTNLTRRVT